MIFLIHSVVLNQIIFVSKLISILKILFKFYKIVPVGTKICTY